MKIVHTADLHLRTADDPRWQALEHIIALVEKNDAPLLVISGDMFDRQIDSQTLKVPLRELFNKRKFKTIILPGNHDGGALAAGDFYGENVSVLSHHEQSHDVEGVRVFGLPFEKISGDQVLERMMSMRDRLRKNATNILLFHGELLDLGYSRDSYGDDEEAGYMPVRLSSFDGMGFDYVLAGHFHTNFEVQRYDGGFFVYPGSPVSITKKETGVRSVNVLTPGDTPAQEPVDTFHYDDLVITLNPFSPFHPLSEVQRKLGSCNPHARILLTVKGFVDLVDLGLSEFEFASELGALRTSQVETILSKWKDISEVRKNELFKRFLAKLEETDFSEEMKDGVRQVALEGMMEAVHAD